MKRFFQSAIGEPVHRNPQFPHAPMSFTAAGLCQRGLSTPHFSHPFTAKTYRAVAIPMATPNVTCPSVTGQGLPATFIPSRPPVTEGINPRKLTIASSLRKLFISNDLKLI